jgi:hypothetical protein
VTRTTVPKPALVIAVKRVAELAIV